MRLNFHIFPRKFNIKHPHGFRGTSYQRQNANWHEIGPEVWKKKNNYCLRRRWQPSFVPRPFTAAKCWSVAKAHFRKDKLLNLFNFHLFPQIHFQGKVIREIEKLQTMGCCLILLQVLRSPGSQERRSAKKKPFSHLARTPAHEYLSSCLPPFS